MEKSNSRTRRTGNGSQKASTKAADTGTPPSPDEFQEGLPTGKVTQRPNERGSDTATLERPTTPRGLQDTFLDERNDVLAVINELEDQLDRHQEIREKLERELNSTSGQLQASNQKCQELEWQVVTLQTRVDALEQLRQDVATLEEELGDASARAQRLGDQAAELEKERNRLKTELKTSNKQLDELWPVRKECEGLRSENRNLTVKIEDLERTQRDMIEARAEVQSQLQEAQISLEEVTGERNQLQGELREAHDTNRELKQVQEALEDKLDQLRAEKKNLQVQMTHLERENARLVEQRQYYETEVTSLRNQSRASDAALTSVKKAFSEVRVALSETKARARRRAINNWPQVGATMHGLDPANAEDTLDTTADETAAIAADTVNPPTDPDVDTTDDENTTAE